MRALLPSSKFQVPTTSSEPSSPDSTDVAHHVRIRTCLGLVSSPSETCQLTFKSFKVSCHTGGGGKYERC